MLNDGGAIAWAMRKNSRQLMSAVNDFVKTHKLGTAFGNTVVAKYELNAKPLRNAISPDELKKFQKTVDLFKKYSSQYSSTTY